MAFALCVARCHIQNLNADMNGLPAVCQGPDIEKVLQSLSLYRRESGQKLIVRRQDFHEFFSVQI